LIDQHSAAPKYSRFTKNEMQQKRDLKSYRENRKSRNLKVKGRLQESRHRDRADWDETFHERQSASYKRPADT